MKRAIVLLLMLGLTFNAYSGCVQSYNAKLRSIDKHVQRLAYASMPIVTMLITLPVALGLRLSEKRSERMLRLINIAPLIANGEIRCGRSKGLLAHDECRDFNKLTKSKSLRRSVKARSKADAQMKVAKLIVVANKHKLFCKKKLWYMRHLKRSIRKGRLQKMVAKVSN